MEGLLKRLTSRKFLLAVGTALTAYANGQYDLAIITVLTYIGIEGLADVVGRFAQQKYVAPVTKQAEVSKSLFSDLEDEDDVDKDAPPVPGM